MRVTLTRTCHRVQSNNWLRHVPVPWRRTSDDVRLTLWSQPETKYSAEAKSPDLLQVPKPSGSEDGEETRTRLQDVSLGLNGTCNKSFSLALFLVDRPVQILKDCGPAALSVELTCLTSEGGGTSMRLLAFIHMIESMLSSRRDFDLAHAYLALFLKVSHSEHVFRLLLWRSPLSFLLCHQFVLVVFSFIFAHCRRTPSPWLHCSASPPSWRLGGQSYEHRLTNHCVCCRTWRVLCCDMFY